VTQIEARSHTVMKGKRREEDSIFKQRDEYNNSRDLKSTMERQI